MTIQEDDFLLEPSRAADLFWDLSILVKVKNKETKEEREEMKNIAYGITLEHAIRYIANYRVQKNNREKALKMLDYLKQYSKELDKLYAACRTEPKEDLDTGD